MENDNVEEKLEMTTKQKYAALSSLGMVNIHAGYRDLDTMLASVENADIGSDGFLSSFMGRGATQYEAVDALWKEATNLDKKKFIVLNATDKEKRRHVRWNGFMWEDIPREE